MKNAVLGMLRFTFLVLAMVGLSSCGGNAASPTAIRILPTATLAEAKPTPTTASTDGAQGEWKTFTRQEGRFSILMLGTPEEASQSSDSPSGKLTVHAFSHSDPKLGLVYSATYLDYPISGEGSDLNKRLASALTAVVGSDTLVAQKEGTVQGIPSIEGEYKDQSGTYTWYKAIIYQNRLFQLFVSTLPAGKETYRDSAKKFLDSFKLLNP